MPDQSIIDEIIERTKRGEELLDDGIIDIAFDQFIEIRALAKKLKTEEE
jgi:hypothetical protein